MKALLRIFLCATSFIWIGCEQTVDPFDVYVPTPKDLLTSGTWRSQSVTSSPSGIGPCERDNLFTFHANGNLTIDQGVQKCNSADPQTFSATWSMNSANTEITVNGWTWVDPTNIWIVDLLNETNFTAHIYFSSGGTIYTVTYVLVRD